jgi:hypothetical protein
VARKPAATTKKQKSPHHREENKPDQKAKTASMKKERKRREGVRLGISSPTLENPEGRKGSSHYPLIDEKSL